MEIQSHVALQWKIKHVLFLFWSFMLSCNVTRKESMYKKMTCSPHQSQRSHGFQTLMSESCAQHKFLAHPTLHTDIKSVLDYVLWHTSQSIKGLKFLYFCTHYFSAKRLIKCIITHFCFIKSLWVLLNTLTDASWFSCSSFLQQPMIRKSIKKK